MTKRDLIEAMERVDDNAEIYVSIFDDTLDDCHIATRTVYFINDDPREDGQHMIHLHIDK